MKSRKIEDWALVTLLSGTVVKALVVSRADGPRRTAIRGVKGHPDLRWDAIRICPEAEPSAHELASRALFAGLTHADPERWMIIATLGPNAACDFADATEGVPQHNSFGQAWLVDGKWGQRPHTKAAVLLHWLGPKHRGE